MENNAPTSQPTKPPTPVGAWFQTRQPRLQPYHPICTFSPHPSEFVPSPLRGEGQSEGDVARQGD